MTIQFVLISEGTSDDGLVDHLEAVLVDLGADEVSGMALDRGRIPTGTGIRVADKLRMAIKLEPSANLFLIHRDADSPHPHQRYQEIESAVGECGLTQSWVAIVPIQETEAWLLLDETAIRRVAGKPRGASPLSLPTAQNVELVASPKEKLQAAIAAASEATGRKRDKLIRDYPNQRQSLLRSLPIDGPVCQVPSWQRMVNDLRAALTAPTHNH